MAIKNSHEIIKEMVADDHINGLLKDPDMRADMERAENPYDYEAGILPPAPAAPEMER